MRGCRRQGCVWTWVNWPRYIQAHAEPRLSLGTTGPESWEFSRSLWEVLACLGGVPVLRPPCPEGREGVQEGRERLSGGAMRLSPQNPSEWLFCMWVVPLSGTGSRLPLCSLSHLSMFSQEIFETDSPHFPEIRAYQWALLGFLGVFRPIQTITPPPSAFKVT